MLRMVMIVALLMGFAVQGQAFEDKMDEGRDFVTPLMAQLDEMGMEPQRDQDGDVLFFHEDRAYLLLFDVRDPEFLILAVPNLWPVEGAEQRRKLAEVVAEVNARAKVARLIETQGHLWAVQEAVFAEPEHAVAALGRLLYNLDNVVEQFQRHMQLATQTGG